MNWPWTTAIETITNSIIAGSPISQTEVQGKVVTTEAATTISTTDNCDQNGVQLFVVQEHENEWRLCNWKSSEKSFGKNLKQSFGYLMTFQVQWGSKYQIPNTKYQNYSGDLKSDHLKSGNIWNQNLLLIKVVWITGRQFNAINPTFQL